MFEGAGEVEADLIAPAPQPLAEMAEAGNIQVGAGFGIDNEAKGLHFIVINIFQKKGYKKNTTVILVIGPSGNKTLMGG